MCQLLGSPLEERGIETREDQTRDAEKGARLYVESRKNRLKRIDQLVQDTSYTGDVNVENPATSSGSASSSSSTSPYDGGIDGGAWSSFA